jgi:hypothetical protein
MQNKYPLIISILFMLACSTVNPKADFTNLIKKYNRPNDIQTFLKTINNQSSPTAFNQFNELVLKQRLKNLSLIEDQALLYNETKALQASDKVLDKNKLTKYLKNCAACEKVDHIKQIFCTFVQTSMQSPDRYQDIPLSDLHFCASYFASSDLFYIHQFLRQSNLELLTLVRIFSKKERLTSVLNELPDHLKPKFIDLSRDYLSNYILKGTQSFNLNLITEVYQNLPNPPVALTDFYHELLIKEVISVYSGMDSDSFYVRSGSSIEDLNKIKKTHTLSIANANQLNSAIISFRATMLYELDQLDTFWNEESVSIPRDLKESELKGLMKNLLYEHCDERIASLSKLCGDSSECIQKVKQTNSKCRSKSRKKIKTKVEVEFYGPRVSELLFGGDDDTSSNAERYFKSFVLCYIQDKDYNSKCSSVYRRNKARWCRNRYYIAARKLNRKVIHEIMANQCDQYSSGHWGGMTYRGEVVYLDLERCHKIVKGICP